MMNLSLPRQFRLDETWSIGGGRDRTSGFLDIRNDVPLGTCVDNENQGHCGQYSGYCTAFALNEHFNFWTVIRVLDFSFSSKDEKWATHVVLFPNKVWFDEWFRQIPERLKAEVLLQGEDKTGVK